MESWFYIFIVLAFLAVKVVVTRSAVKSSPQATPTQSHFSYGVDDDKTGNKFTHQQATNGLATQGEYRVELPDGRTQVVSYRADENGYNAVVTYEGVAVHPDDDETSASNIVTRPPIPSTPHPSRQRPVIAIPSVRRPSKRPAQKRLQRVPTAAPLPDQRRLPNFPQSDLGIDVPIFHDQEDLQSVDHPIPFLPPGNQFLRGPPKFRRSEPVVPKPTVVPTGIPTQQNFVEQHSNAHGSPFFSSPGQEFALNDVSQFHSQFDSNFQNLPVIHEQPTLLPHTDFSSLSDPFLPSDVDLNNIFIDIPKINTRLPNGGNFPTTTDLSLFVPEEDLRNGNFPGLVSNTVPIFQFPVNSHNGINFVQDQPLSFSVTPTGFPLGPIHDHVTTIRHHGTPSHEQIHLPPQPVIPVPQHGTPSPFSPSFTHQIRGPPFQGSGGHHGSLQHLSSLNRHGLSTPQHGSLPPNHVIDIPRQGTAIPIRNHNIQVTGPPADDHFSSHIDHNIPNNDQSSFTHDVSPISFHPNFRPSTSFLSNQSPVTPLSQHVRPTPLHSNFVSRQGTPHPQVTSPVFLQGNSFVQHGTPFPIITSAVPQHEIPLIQHGTPTSFISSPAPQGKSLLPLGSQIPGTSSPFPQLGGLGSQIPGTSSPFPQLGGLGSQIPGTSSPFPQLGGLRPIITSPIPFPGGSTPFPGGSSTAFPGGSTSFPGGSTSFPGGSISHGRTPVPSFTRPAPSHTGTVSRLGSPGPLLTTLNPLHATSGSHTRRPIQRFSSPAPHLGFASQAPHFGFTSQAPHFGFTSQAPHFGFTSQAPNIDNPASHIGSPLSQFSTPAPHFGFTSQAPHFGFTSQAPNIDNPASHIGSPLSQFSTPAPHFGFTSQAPHFGFTSQAPNIDNPASHIGSPLSQFSTPAPHFGFTSQASNFDNPVPHIGSPLSQFSTPAPRFDNPASHTGRSSQISSAVPHSSTFNGASPFISSPSPRPFGPPSQFVNSFPVVSSPIPEQGSFNIPSRTSVPLITSPFPRFGSPPPHINQISSPVTPAPPSLSSTFRPSVSRAPFIPSPFDNRVSRRPIQNALGPKNEPPPPSASRVGRRRINIPKTLSPFQPGEGTLDREQFLRHKGISARSVRSPLKKPKTKTKS